MNEIQQQVSQTIKKLIYQPDHSFYGIFLTGINRQITDKVPTAAVSYRNHQYYMYINPTFWSTLNNDQRVFLMEHEVMHIVKMHLLTHGNYPHHVIDNLATDCEIHEYITPLIDGSITLDLFKKEFPEGNWTKRAGRDHYYRELMKIKEKYDEKMKELTEGHEHEWDELTEGEKIMAKIQMEHRISEVAKQCGKVPDHIQSIIDSFIKPKPEFDWKRILRRFVSNSGKVHIKFTRSKPNVFYEDARAPKVKFKNRLLWIVDTSGSVSDDELLENCNEMYHLHKMGYQIHTMCVDSQCHPIKEYNGKPTFEINGRGGTDFNPAIEIFNNGNYDLAVYFTDGQAPCPIRANKPLMWVISSRGTSEYIKSHNGKILLINK